MASKLERILDFESTKQPVSDAQNFLERFGAFDTVAHEQQVAYTAVRLALQNGVAKRQAEAAAWLHDLSSIIPNEERVAACAALNVDLLPVETEHPVLSHGKLSRALAELVLGVEDRAVLAAVQCHTALRPGATPLDKVLFLADKLESDNPTLAREYRHDVEAGLAQSLEAGCLAYLAYVVDNASRLGWPLHPDLAAAHEELAAKVAVAPPPPPPKPAAPAKPSKSRSRSKAKSKQPKFTIKGPLTSRPRAGTGPDDG